MKSGFVTYADTVPRFVSDTPLTYSHHTFLLYGHTGSFTSVTLNVSVEHFLHAVDSRKQSAACVQYMLSDLFEKNSVRHAKPHGMNYDTMLEGILSK